MNRHIIGWSIFFILCITFLAFIPVSAQDDTEPEKPKSLVTAVLEIIFGKDVTEVPEDAPQEVVDAINALSGTPIPVRTSEFDDDADYIFSKDLPQISYEAYGLKTPNKDNVNTFLAALSNEPSRTWAKRCLYYEKVLKSKGHNVNHYLLCGWVWLEGMLNPYAVNCKDNTNVALKQGASEYCSNSADRPGDKNGLLQLSGYQAFDQAVNNNYRKYYNECYGDKPLSEVLTKVYSESAQSPNDFWSYPKQSGKGLIAEFGGEDGLNVDENVIASSKQMMLDRRSQYYTALLGKDDCVRVGLNISATGRLPQDIGKASWWKGWYISHEQELADKVGALVEFDKQILANQEAINATDSASTDTGVEIPTTAGPPAQGCPTKEENIISPGSDFKLLNRRDKCVKPTMIVIHWTVGWIPPSATYNVLNDRGLSCQYGTGHNSSGNLQQIQMLYMFDDVVERAACVKRYGNTINFEISGDSFDQVYKNPSHKNYANLMGSDGNGGTTKKALDTVCWLMKKYSIPASQIYGHLELNPEDKKDPGAAYITYFREQVALKCK